MTIDVTEVKRRLFVFLNDVNLVNEYIRQYGPTIDVKNIKAIKETLSGALQSEGAASVGTDPIYTLEVGCPVCNLENIPRYELRAKSQQVTQNKFLVALYNGVSPYRTVDYIMLAVTVCPRCLFASPDKKDFNYAGFTAQNENKTQMTSNVLMTLQEKIGERKGHLKPGCDVAVYFGRNRTREAAIDSYRLAITRAKIEAWYEQPYALYKLGAAYLRIAKLMKDALIDNNDCLHEALHCCEEAFKTSNCPSEEIEMQVIYTIVALSLKLKDQKKANSYIGVFNNLHNTRQAEIRSNPKLSLSIIDKWTDKAKFLWEDRNEKDLFINE
jgi:uncharacterized protein (DUF2225 family)